MKRTDNPPMAASGVRGGPVAMLIDAARGLGLDADQRPHVEAAEDRLRETDLASLDAATTALRSELASAIRTGHVDPRALTPRYAAFSQALGAQLAREAASAATLHAALQPGQRAAAAKAVRDLARVVWSSQRRGASWLERATSPMELTHAQMDRARAVFPDDGVVDGRSLPLAEALLGPFEADVFDDRPFGAHAAVNADAGIRGLREFIVSLTAKQREAFGAK
jgi:hypothetical protein